MIQSFQNAIHKSCVNIKLDLRTNTLAGNGSEENIVFTFQRINDFEPEQVARQIPQLRAERVFGIGKGMI
ncbi:type VI secretion system contractile sheath small subunit [Photorhabdus thracensis]|nr:type VI secretion system contractile sheath small subunit [Photorhabdus thracensis]